MERTLLSLHSLLHPLLKVFLVLLSFALTACGSDKSSSEQKQDEMPVKSIAEISLVAACSGCHGDDGVSSKPGVPYIAGLSKDYLEIAMRGYLNGNRRHDVMRQAIMGLKVEERMELANYYGILETPWKGGQDDRAFVQSNRRSQDISPKSVSAGKELSRPCEGCHGADGNSNKPGVPSIAGLQPAYFVPALKAYLSGARQGAAIMKNFKLALSDNDINNLAAYFAVQQRNKSPISERLQKTIPSDALVPLCTGCHGENGNSTHPAMPTLAGQNASYLIKAMLAYRDGERSNEMMVAVAKGLSDKDIESNATYFATRNPTQAKINDSASTQGKQFDPLGDGARMAASCNACHGKNGNNPYGEAPRLAGLGDAYLRSAITAYRDGVRNHAEMKVLTEFLNDIDIEKLSLFYASQDPEQAKSSIKNAEADRGSELSSSCAGCHGKEGNSEDPKVPSLAGQSAAYLLAAIKSYKENGSRSQKDMVNAVKDLDVAAVKNLAQYYSQLIPVARKPRTPEGPQEMAQKCNRCHGDDGAKPDPGKPRISKQRKSYIVSSLLAYKNGDRTNSIMEAMSKELWLVEIDAIATYYSSR